MPNSIRTVSYTSNNMAHATTHGADPEKQYGYHDGSSTLTHEPTTSDTADHHATEHAADAEKNRLHLNVPRRSMDQASDQRQYLSPTDTREQATQLVDDLMVLQAERKVSNQEKENDLKRTVSRVRTRQEEDAFNQHQPTVQIGLPQEPPSKRKQP